MRETDEWTVGISPFEPQYRQEKELENILINMNEKCAREAFGRAEVIKQLAGVLISEGKPNALLTGPAGCGKTRIVEGLAHMINCGSPKLPPQLQGTIIYSLSLSSLTEDTRFYGQLEAKLNKVISYLAYSSAKVILFIDEIHLLCKNMPGDSEYKKIAELLKPVLGRGNIKCIGATTTQEASWLDYDPAFNRRFTRVKVDEMTKEQTKGILLCYSLELNSHYGCNLKTANITEECLEQVVNVADEYHFAGAHRPDNAITLMDCCYSKAVMDASWKGEKEVELVLDEKLIRATAYQLASGNSKQKNFDLRELQKDFSVIKGQEKVIEEITKAIRLRELHIRPMTKPLSFLFVGPTGVGKTELSKILSKTYVGLQPIVLNMSEYYNSASINRIIGSPAGYEGHHDVREMPFDQLETNPYQLILLDELEKADSAVQRLFLSVLDEGYLYTCRGKRIDFSKCILVATTNAGFDGDYSIGDLAKYFDVEFLNRFEHICEFKPISREVYEEIIRGIYKEEIKKIDRISGKLTNRTVKRIADKTFNPLLGARPAKRAVYDYIEECLMNEKGE